MSRDNYGGQRANMEDDSMTGTLAEQVDQTVCVTLVRAGGTEGGPLRLTAGKVPRPVRHPGIGPPGRGRVGPDSLGWIGGNMVGSCHDGHPTAAPGSC